MKTLTIRRIRRVLRRVPGSTRSDRRRAAPCALPLGRPLSAPLDRSPAVPLCVLCFEAGRATEATFQTSEMLCGCDDHTKQLERHGRAAIRDQRLATRHGTVESSDALVRLTSANPT